MIKHFALYIAIMSTLASCGQPNPPRDINSEHSPQRVISAAPLITEVVYALGMQHKLVGRTHFCTYPHKAQQIASIGSIREPNIETIIGLKPDLVITSTHFSPSNRDKLKALGIRVESVLNQQSLGGAYQTIRGVAQLLGCKERGDSLVTIMENRRLALLKDTPTTINPPTVYYVVGFGKGGDFTAAGNTFINDLINMSGGINIADGTSKWRYNLEDLMAANPDIVLVRQGWKADFCSTQPYKHLKAVKTNNVYEIDNHLFELNGPRIMDALEELIAITTRHQNHQRWKN